MFSFKKLLRASCIRSEIHHLATFLVWDPYRFRDMVLFSCGKVTGKSLPPQNKNNNKNPSISSAMFGDSLLCKISRQIMKCSFASLEVKQGLKSKQNVSSSILNYNFLVHKVSMGLIHRFLTPIKGKLPNILFEFRY